MRLIEYNEKKQSSEEEDNSEDSITQEELFAIVQQLWKGKRKGRGKGVCWNCGESDHCSRDCPGDKHDGWTDAVSWKKVNVTQDPARAQANDETREGAAGLEAGPKVRNCRNWGSGVIKRQARRQRKVEHLQRR